MVSQELNDIVKKGFKLFLEEWKLFVSIGIFSVIPLLMLNILVFMDITGTILMLIVAGLANLFAFMTYVLATKHYLEKKTKKTKNRHKLEKKTNFHIKNSYIPLIGTILLIQLIFGLILAIIGGILTGIYLILLLTIPTLANHIITQILFITIGIMCSGIAIVFTGIHLYFAPMIVVLEKIKIVDAIKKSIKIVKEKFAERFVTILAIKIIGVVISLAILLVLSPFEVIELETIKNMMHMISIVAQQIGTIPIAIIGVIYYLSIKQNKTSNKKTTKHIKKKAKAKSSNKKRGAKK